MDPATLDHYLEQISQQGCSYTLKVIDDLENNNNQLLTHLSTADQKQLLTELKQIMAIYER